VVKHRAALAAAEDAITLYRDLARSEPARHTPDLARSLVNLGNLLAAVGKHRAALAATEEAITLYRDLARSEPARHTPNLALSLANFGNQLRRSGQLDQELAVRAEAVAWRARLAALHPDDHRATYLQARADLAKLFTEQGFDVGAAIAAEDTAQRALAQDDQSSSTGPETEPPPLEPSEHGR
jgi:tetratricopeptide (TPR) repeat protein